MDVSVDDATEADHAMVLYVYMRMLFDEGRLCDVSVICDGQHIARCHRVVLAAFSTHFDVALNGVDASGELQLELDSDILGTTVDNMRSLISFMYTSRIDPLQENIKRSAQNLGCVSLVSLLQSEEAKSGHLVEDACHPQRLLQSLRKFYMENKYADVHLLCQGVPLTYCHRVVLSAYSSHFESALSATDTEGCVQVTLDIDSNVTGVTILDLRTIVNYLYSGIIRVSSPRARCLYAAARSLSVVKLMDVLMGVGPCQGHLQKHSQPSDMDEYIVDVGEPAVDYDSDGTEHYIADESSIASPQRLSKAPGLENREVAAQEVVDDSKPVIHEEEMIMPSTSTADYPPHLGTMVTELDEKQAEAEYVDIFAEYIEGPMSKRGGSFKKKLDMRKRQQWQNASTVGYMNRKPSRRRTRPRMDKYGFGLPEIEGPDAASQLPLMVGDQRELMEKPFKCPYCDHRAKEKSAIEKHIRCIHTLEAPYKCQYCSQAFKVQSNLVRHIRAHKGEKPYECKKCGQTYADKKNMDAHVYREHLKIKQLECPEMGCQARFWRHDRFVLHCRRKHAMAMNDVIDDASNDAIIDASDQVVMHDGLITE